MGDHAAVSHQNIDKSKHSKKNINAKKYSSQLKHKPNSTHPIEIFSLSNSEPTPGPAWGEPAQQTPQPYGIFKYIFKIIFGVENREIILYRKNIP